MKYLNVSLILLLFITIYSCSEETIQENVSSTTFEESVAIIEYGTTQFINTTDDDNKIALTIELVNFNNNINLEKEYTIDFIQYNDDGKFNDKVAGDGIYTSVQTFSKEFQEINPELNEIIYNRGELFKYSDKLTTLLNEKINEQQSLKSTAKITIKFGCKLRRAECPEYKSCWPFSSPCTCIEYYDCEGSIEWES